jgi:hypothetical protein
MPDKKVWFITGAGRGMGVESDAVGGKRRSDVGRVPSAHSP